MKKVELLKKYLEGAYHNLLCYSENYLMNTPKPEYKENWQQALKEVELLKKIISECYRPLGIVVSVKSLSNVLRIMEQAYENGNMQSYVEVRIYEEGIKPHLRIEQSCVYAECNDSSFQVEGIILKEPVSEDD